MKISKFSKNFLNVDQFNDFFWKCRKFVHCRTRKILKTAQPLFDPLSLFLALTQIVFFESRTYQGMSVLGNWNSFQNHQLWYRKTNFLVGHKAHVDDRKRRSLHLLNLDWWNLYSNSNFVYSRVTPKALIKLLSKLSSNLITIKNN